uniref:Zinc finger GRF-type domain-containing protein n=1 Tax=Oryza punctata TaxID=4537 RepID=A0A0E0LZY0_ORYPU
MATRSSGSSSSAHRRRPDLALIQCRYCRVKNIIELTTMTCANRGCILFHMSRPRDGSGCNYWYWEDGYVKYLERNGFIGDKELVDVKQMSVKKKVVHSEDGREDEVKKLMLSLVAIGLEIIQVLKDMLFGCILVVVALVCLVHVVWLK